MKVTGILSISNGCGLHYPFPLVVENLSRLCDDVLVGVDPIFSKDEDVVKSLNLKNVSICHSKWDRSYTAGGFEIAKQMDYLVDVAKNRGSDWVVVMQADELLHDDDFALLRFIMHRTESVGLHTERIYFWRDLKTIRKDWSANLVRIFRPGFFSFTTEGTDKSGMYSGQVKPGLTEDTDCYIYHYSRIDSPDVISRRVRNLDTFFHKEEDLLKEEELPEYDFVARQYDNYSIKENPPLVEGRIKKYVGTHPEGVEDWYR